MHKNTKAAFAATAAAVLLLGGAGTLASWNDSETIDGGAIKSGKLSLAEAEACTGWTLDGGAAFNPASTLVVPGDVITQTCTYTVNAAGDHLAATVGLATPSFAVGSNATLVEQLDASGTYSLDDADVETPPNPVFLEDDDSIGTTDDGKVLTAVVSVTFDAETSGTTAQDVTATLNALTVSLTHDHA